MRSIGLDIHRDFAEVAIAEGGEVLARVYVAMESGGFQLGEAS